MPSAEDRIVSIQFDNKKFEASVATTMGTLDKLKVALRFDGVKSGLNDVSFETRKFEEKLSESNGMLSKFKTDLGFGGAKASLDDIPFEKRRFEENLTGATGMLDKFKIALGFNGVKTGFSEIERASSDVKFAGITTALDNVSGKFTAMSAIAFTVLQNVTNRVIDAGIQMGKGLTLDQTISGFREYEQNMNAIQTILSNTKADNTNLTDVNAALDELNTYSDQTIYNFGEMTRNIGTFTAAGIDLDTSVSAIKGIANLAAISGSSSAQASTAMYQLSQALASGSVKLMDWNSIVNAGMGGEVFQKALFESGKALGTIADVDLDTTFEQWKDAGNTFRTSLEDGWLTGEVLTNTLQGFTGDLTEAQLLSMGYTAEQTKGIMEMGQTGKDAATKVKTLTQLISTVKESIGSGWSASFRIIFGDFEEAKELFTGVSEAIGNIVGKSADARNALLNGWKDMGGRTLLIQALGDAFRGLGVVFNTIKSAFQEIFPPMTSERLFELTQRFADFTKKLTPSAATLDSIKRVFKGVFAALSIGVTIVKEVFGVFGDLFTRFSGFSDGGGILGFLAGLGDRLVSLKESLVDGGGIAAFFDDIPGKIANFINGFLGIFSSFDTFKAKIAEFWNAFAEGFNGIDFSGVGGPLVGFFNQIGLMVGGVKDFFNDATGGAVDKVGERFGWLTGIIDGFKNSMGWAADKIGSLKDRLGELASYIKEQFSSFDDKLAEGLDEGGYDKTLDTLNTGIFAAIAIAITSFLNNGVGITGFIGNISDALENLSGVLVGMQTNLKAKALLNIAIGLAILAAALLVLSLIDSKALTKAIVAMAFAFAQLVGVLYALQSLSLTQNSVSLALTAAAILMIAAAMVVLSLAMKILSTMDWDELARGLAGVLGLMGILAVTIKPLSDNEGGLILTGLGLIAIAVALNVMAVAMKIMASMSWDEMIRGLVGVAGALAALVIAVQYVPTSIFVDALGIVALAVALNILALAVFAFGNMDLDTIYQGTLAIAGGLVLLGAALYAMPPGPGLVLQGAGLLAVSLGLVAMAKAVHDLGSMDPVELQSGLLAIGIALGGLAIGLYAMTGTVGGAFALGIASVALLALSVAVRSFAKLSWKELIIGLVAMGGAMAIIAIASLALAPAVGPILALGVALALLGAAFILFGAGAYLAALAFSIIANAGQEGVDAFVGIIEALITNLPSYVAALVATILDFVSAILEALPRLIGSLSDILVALFDLVIDNAPALGKAFVALVLAGLKALREIFPEIVATGYELLLEMLRGIRDNIGDIVTLVAEIVAEFADSFVNNIGSFVESGVKMLVAFLQAIIDNLWQVTDIAGDIVAWLVVGIANIAWKIVQAGIDALVDFLDGITQAIPLIAGKITEIVVAITTAIGNEVPKVVDAGFKMFIALFDGLAQVINENSGELGRAMGGLASALVKGIGNALKEAIKQIANDLFPGLGTIVSGILDFFGIASPSKLFYWIGEMLMTGLDDGIHDNFNRPVESIEAGSGRILDAVTNTMAQVPSMLENIEEFNPTITPVLDLTGVTKSATQLGGILGVAQMSADLSYGQANALLQATRQRDEATVSAEVQAPREIRFEQTINAPVALSNAEIFRQTRSQLAMAKEELNA